MNDIFAPGSDPLRIMRAWLADAWRTEPADANAAALATATAAARPNVRMVLVKEVSEGVAGRLVFNSNAGSSKGAEIAENPVAALAWHWKSRERQVRVRGPVQEVPAAETDAYFRSRPLQSRQGAWASRQSRPIESRDALMRNLQIAAERFPEDPPRPEWWRGYALRPLEVEFWVQGACRLHDRALWVRPDIDSGDWRVQRLQP